METILYETIWRSTTRMLSANRNLNSDQHTYLIHDTLRKFLSRNFVNCSVAEIKCKYGGKCASIWTEHIWKIRSLRLATYITITSNVTALRYHTACINALFYFFMPFSMVYWLACLSLDWRFAGSIPAVDDGFLRAIKIRRHDFLRRGSNHVGFMS
jgi:hypothetical protein